VPLEAAGGVEGISLAEGGGNATALPTVLHVRGILAQDEAAAAVQVAASKDTRFNTDADSVDGWPAYELYPLYRGLWQHPALEAALRPKAEERLLPFVRARFLCPGCVLCDSLLRRLGSAPACRRTATSTPS